MTDAAGTTRDHSLRVLLAGGGTAGHIEPALALADSLVRRMPAVKICALGTASGLENVLVPARGIELHLIPRVPFPRKLSRSHLSLPIRMSAAVKSAEAVLRQVSPDVVVGFGGYVALPAYLAARRMGLPFVVHEQNVRAGLANWIGARMTPFVAVSSHNSSLPHARFTGLPLRRSIATLDRSALRRSARQSFGLQEGTPTLLVFGGSQGALTINEAMRAAARGLLDLGIQVLHAAGPGNHVEVLRSADDPPYVHVQYLDRMDMAYAAADFAVCRSGAGTCAELSAVGLPALFVPYPHSNGEQDVNAADLVRSGGGLLISDDRLTGSILVDLVSRVLLHPERCESMSKAIAAFGQRDADDQLADLVLEAARATI